jgi:S-formylglutathione hydrolase FrmB
MGQTTIPEANAAVDTISIFDRGRRVLPPLLAWLALAYAGALGDDEAGVVSIAAIAPRIEAVTHQSRVLGRQKSFCAVLPEGYDRTKPDWPVLVLLHGRGRNERTLIDHPAARESLLAADFVIVLPNGDDGWYVDSPVRPADRYAAHLEEVLAVAERQYHLSRDRRRRALAGWSMGGYGCARFAQTHAAEFISVAPIIALLDYPRDPSDFPPGQSYPVQTQVFGGDPAVWPRFNPIEQAEKLRGMSILLLTGDEAFDRTMNERFSRRLNDLGIPNSLKTLHGPHAPETVREALPLVIEHTRSAFRAAAR